MADLNVTKSQLSPCHEPEPTTPLSPDKQRRDSVSPTSTSETSTCATSPCFSMFEKDTASTSQRDRRASSTGSSDFEDLGDARVQQLPVSTDMPHLDLNKPGSLLYQGTLSPRQESGKRYHGGYLQQRVPKAAGLLKGWKRRYFRIRKHGLVCYKTQDAATPLFEMNFTSQSALELGKMQEQMSSNGNGISNTSWPIRTSSSSGSLTLILNHVEITGYQKAAKAVEVPLVLKAEDEADHAAWTECLRFVIEARKRELFQVKSPSEEDTDEIASPHLNDRNRSSTVIPDILPMDNSLVKVETFEAFSKKYLLMKEIGEGSFSIVHRAVNRMTGQVCAVKCCKISQALEEEERLLRTLSHPNIVSLEGVYQRDTNLHYVVMDYLKDGDLCDLLIERQRLQEPEARRIIRQVVEGLAYLHRRCVLHRDIKPENILLHGNMVKIADFGLAKELAQSTTTLKNSCGTLEYAAPELLCGQPYGLKSDVFSLGIVLYVLLFGSFPFSVESAAALQCMDHFPTGVDVRDMSCLRPSSVQWQIVSPLAQDALLKMLKTDVGERISAEDLLCHPWFNEDDDRKGATSTRATPEEFECARIEDCEALGFAELLARGFQVVKYGYKESTVPHSTSLTLNFIEESITWTARNSKNGTAGRAIPLREIKEIREGHTTNAFLSHKDSKPLPRPELCLSIICPWRTLDLVMEAPSQREFMVRGLRRLLL
ncbi:Calcium/calmodulin-dependent protein kinase type II alpha chain [Phytophthora citrophthora]|uniref:Calcium/calmodulin-dependent protein kinase type II alpha chain n=1 Tax=Phytophthora citrophthora TaxID=4793 RepID=A0AAD9GTD2_9STRA|nr:Calcium/calmodulin-dependent protein kinase type II alpha chain [Phytophthora citrophthora]